MNKIKKLLLSALLSVISMSPVFADHHEKLSVKTSTLKEFRELCELLEGRWNADILWINEWPGANAVRGETVKGHAKVTRILDGAALEMKSMQGTEESTWRLYYHPATSQIRSLYLTSGGTVGYGTLFKISDTEYGEKVDGAQKGGGVITGDIKWVFSDDGRSFMTRSKNIKLDGKPLGELKDLYKKVSP
ncbi:MAG: hypothetical protein QNK82_11915 [Akkermansiaceae bacterium]|jgi:hypothetical protein|tara:strand:+ start:9216 stop:9785 length:570 start_codon:yes stop_codon:yes gene_type:complete